VLTSLATPAEELIHLFAFAMRFGITDGQMRDTVHAFPTFPPT